MNFIEQGIDKLQRLFGTPETWCGIGSKKKNTRKTVELLNKVLITAKYRIDSIVDIGCGDWNWMKDVDLNGAKYCGIDSDKDFIETNRETYNKYNPTMSHIVEFLNFDIRDIPNNSVHFPYNRFSADLAICRDLFIHLPEVDIFYILSMLKASGCRYLLANSYYGEPHLKNNEDKFGNLIEPTFVKFYDAPNNIDLEQYKYSRKKRNSRLIYLDEVPYNTYIKLIDYELEEEPHKYIGLWEFKK